MTRLGGDMSGSMRLGKMNEIRMGWESLGQVILGWFAFDEAGK